MRLRSGGRPKYGQVQGKSSEEVAHEAALRWKAKSGIAEKSSKKWRRRRWKAEYVDAPKKARTKDRTREREKIEPDPTPAARTRGRDFDLSL